MGDLWRRTLGWRGGERGMLREEGEKEAKEKKRIGVVYVFYKKNSRFHNALEFTEINFRLALPLIKIISNQQCDNCIRKFNK